MSASPTISAKLFAQQLTNTYHLGSHTVTYIPIPYKQKGCFFTFFIGGGTILSLAMWILHNAPLFGPSYQIPAMYGTYAIALFLIGLVIIATATFSPSKPIYASPTYIFTEGFVIMAQNEPITIARWEDIQGIGEVRHTQYSLYREENRSHPENHNQYTYHFLTKSNDLLNVNIPLYTEYFNTYRYSHLSPQSFQHLTQLQAGSPVCFGNVTITSSGISAQGLSYGWSETHSIFLNMQANTLDIFFHIPSASTPTVVKRRPEHLTLTLQGDIDLFEKLLYSVIRHTHIFYSLNDSPTLQKDSHARYQHIWPPGQKISPHYRKESGQ